MKFDPKTLALMKKLGGSGDGTVEKEVKTVELNMASGDMTVYPTSGKLMSQVIIKKPEDLVPENIKSGENIGGVNGEFEGEAVETESKTLGLAMAAGDMVIEPTDGKYLSEVTIEKPVDLSSENIKSGKNIGGIVGTYDGEPVETETVSVGLTMENDDMVITPSSGKYLAEVTIEKPADLLPENILAGKNIGGVVGELEVGTGGGSDDVEWINDGNTHIWVTLTEERKSPLLVFKMSIGKVNIDWGDGSEPEVKERSSGSYYQIASKKHEYAKAGTYVITLSGDAPIEISISGNTSSSLYKQHLLRNSTDDKDHTSHCYAKSVSKLELGTQVTNVAGASLSTYTRVKGILVPGSIKNIVASAFSGISAALDELIIENGVETIGAGAFSGIYMVKNLSIPPSVTTIGSNAFGHCTSMLYVDFSEHSSVPVLESNNAFTNVSLDCEFRVPATLVDEWKAATNWSTYADQIVAKGV